MTGSLFISSIILMLSIARACDESACANYGRQYFFEQVDPVQPSDANAVGTIDVGDTFQVSFDIVPNAIISDWGSIFRIGDRDKEDGDTVYERSPGIWFWPGTTELHIRLSDTGNDNSDYDIAIDLDIGTSYNVKLTVCDGVVTSYLDGVQIVQQTNRNVIPRNDATVWIGDKWFDPAQATISNLYVQPCVGDNISYEPKVCSHDESRCANYGRQYFFEQIESVQPSDANAVGTIDVGDSLQVSFDIVPNGIVSDWGSIFRVGDRDKEDGDNVFERTPGIWFWPGTTQLHIRLSDDENDNSDYDIMVDLDIGTSYNIKLTVCDGVVTSYLDDVEIALMTEREILTRDDATVWIGDKWYGPADATISNLYVQPCVGEEISYEPAACDESTCDNFGPEYFFEQVAPVEPSFENAVGTIDVGASFQVSFDIVPNAIISDWGSIFRIGDRDKADGDTVFGRTPGIWFWPGTTQLHIRLSDDENDNSDYDILVDLVVGTSYNIKLTVCDGVVTSYLDNVPIVQMTDRNIITRDDATVWIGDKWYDPAQATISNLYVKPCVDEMKYIGEAMPMIFTDAENYCESQYGTNLASISSDDDNEDAATEANVADDEEDLFWIGLTRNGKQNNEWLDETALVYTNFVQFINVDPGQSGIVKDCYALNRARNDMWVPKPCSLELPFICNAP